MRKHGLQLQGLQNQCKIASAFIFTWSVLGQRVGQHTYMLS